MKNEPETDLMPSSKEVHKTNGNTSEGHRNRFQGAPTDQIRTIITSKRIAMVMDYNMSSRKKNP